MKLRGQRIELGEIEHALRAILGVDEAVVLVHANELVAYVSPAEVVGVEEPGGPAETVDVTARCVSDLQLPSRLASIGKPLPNVTCYVVDPDALPGAPALQPIGVWGELWLGGVQVARGYLNRPELTADRFVPNPWAETDASGRGVVYRTGDRVRWCAHR